MLELLSPIKNKTLRYATIMLLLCPLVGVSVAAEPGVSPRKADFGLVSLGRQSDPFEILILDRLSIEGTAIQQPIFDPSTNQFRVLSFDNWIKPGGFGRIVMQFTPSLAGTNRTTLIIPTIVHEKHGQKPYKLAVPTLGEGVCDDIGQDCDPCCRLCTVDTNVDYHYDLKLTDLPDRVGEAISNQNIVHIRSTRKYTLPLEQLARLAGIKPSEILGREGAAKDCKSIVEFEHLRNLQWKTRFVWKKRNHKYMKLAGVLAGKLEFEISSDHDLDGYCVVRPSAIELHFFPNMRPHLLLKDGSEVIFDNEISCIGSGRDFSVVRHSQSPPARHLYIHR